jgi:hypothetical protein
MAGRVEEPVMDYRGRAGDVFGEVKNAPAAFPARDRTYGFGYEVMGLVLKGDLNFEK